LSCEIASNNLLLLPKKRTGNKCQYIIRKYRINLFDVQHLHLSRRFIYLLHLHLFLQYFFYQFHRLATHISQIFICFLQLHLLQLFNLTLLWTRFRTRILFLPQSYQMHIISQFVVTFLVQSSILNIRSLVI
jgi:hypothetical protein